MMTEREGDRMLHIVGYRQLWSKDRNTLVQVFTDLDTDSIELVTIDTRPNGLSSWESLTQVRTED
jgi:hypothetical protein